VFVVAVTRKRDDVNPALTVSTRISIELEMTVPNAAQRRDVSLLPSTTLLPVAYRYNNALSVAVS